MIMRRKSRYILVRSTRPLDIEVRDREYQFLKEVERFMGIGAYCASHPKIANKAGSNMFIVKVNRGSECSFALATSFIKRIADMDIGFQTVKTSGSISQLKRLAAKS